jgi:hypothetical protein
LARSSSVFLVAIPQVNLEAVVIERISTVLLPLAELDHAGSLTHLVIGEVAATE